MAKAKRDTNPRVRMSPEIEALRASKLAAPHPCYDGQWTVHPTHDYEVIVMAWLGGGKHIVTCPGVTEGNTLPERHARAAAERAKR